MDQGAAMGWEMGCEGVAALQRNSFTAGYRVEPREQLKCSWRRLQGGDGLDLSPLDL